MCSDRNKTHVIKFLSLCSLAIIQGLMRYRPNLQTIDAQQTK